MKVLEFAKRLGIPASKIRFYDRQGITQSRRGSENNYRQFTEQDALVIYNAQMLRSFDMSVKEVSTAAHTYALGRFSGWLEERIAALEQELRLEQMRMARLEQLRGYLRAMSEQGAGVLRMRTKVSYNAWTIGPGAFYTGATLSAMERLQGKMPFSYVTLMVPQESLLGGEEALQVRLGLGILKENMEKCGFEGTAGLERFPEGDCLSLYLEREDPFALTRADLAPLFLEAGRLGARIVSGAVGRQYLAYEKEGRTVHGFSLGVLIETGDLTK